MEDFEAKINSLKQSMMALSHKVKAAAKFIEDLKSQRDALKSELEFLREENKQSRLLISENEKLMRDRIWTQNRIEKIYKKIEAAGI